MGKLKYSNKRVIEVSDWDELVEETYGRPYSFQQQEGCKSRGTFDITIPEEADDSYMNDSIPEIINGDKMGVKFDVWLARNPKAPLNPTKEDLKECNYYWGKTAKDEAKWKEDENHIYMFWERNFYPDVQMVANDLHKRGLIEEGEYVINIDW